MYSECAEAPLPRLSRPLRRLLQHEYESHSAATVQMAMLTTACDRTSLRGVCVRRDEGGPRQCWASVWCTRVNTPIRHRLLQPARMTSASAGCLVCKHRESEARVASSGTTTLLELAMCPADSIDRAAHPARCQPELYQDNLR